MVNAILVTGAAGGIGKPSVLQLANAGFTVYAGALNSSELDELGNLHINVKPVMIDVSNERSIAQAIATIAKDEREGLFGVWSNAGIAQTAPLRYVSCQEIDAVVRVNLTGPLWLIRSAIPLMRAGGRIMITGSATGMLAAPCVSVYGATKWGLEGLADALRLELGAVGIHVSLLQPGMIKTPLAASARVMIEAVLACMSADDKAAYAPMLGKLANFSDPALRGSDPEVVAVCVMHAFLNDKPRSRYRVGGDSKTVAVLRHLPDGLRDWLQRRVTGI